MQILQASKAGCEAIPVFCILQSHAPFWSAFQHGGTCGFTLTLVQDCPVFASQLAQLPQLSELFVTKGYTQGSWEGPLATQEGSATFERFLHSLKRLGGLRVLRVAAINDDVSLSRLFSHSLDLFWACKRGFGGFCCPSRCCFFCKVTFGMPWAVEHCCAAFHLRDAMMLIPSLHTGA